MNLAWLPIENGVLSLEDRDLAFALFDAFRIHCNPQTALEITFVKKMAFHQWSLDRLDKIEQALLQTNLDSTLPNLTKQSRETLSAEPADSVAFAHAYNAMVQNSDRTLRQLDRDRRTHQRSLRDYARRLKELKKDFPPAIYEEIGSELLASHFGVIPEQTNTPNLDTDNEAEATKEPTHTEDVDFDNNREVSEEMPSQAAPDTATDEPKIATNAAESNQALTEETLGDQPGRRHPPTQTETTRRLTPEECWILKPGAASYQRNAVLGRTFVSSRSWGGR